MRRNCVDFSPEKAPIYPFLLSVLEQREREFGDKVDLSSILEKEKGKLIKVNKFEDILLYK